MLVGSLGAIAWRRRRRRRRRRRLLEVEIRVELVVRSLELLLCS